MPWSHCEVAFILDDEDCPACGLAKAAWTVELDRTRTLVIGLPGRRPRAWLELELLDASERPVAGQPYVCELANGRDVRGELDALGQARVEPLHAGPCRVTFPGLARGPVTREAAPARAAGGGAPGAAADGAAAGGTRTAGDEPRGAPSPTGREPAPVECAVPLRTRLRSLERARAWVAAHPLEVRVDGARVPAAAVVERPDLVRVVFRAAPGERRVLVSSQAGGRRAVLASQRVVLAGAGPAHPGGERPGAAGALAAPPAGPPGAPRSLTRAALDAAAAAARREARPATEALEIDREHVEGGGGRRHVFRLEGRGLKACLPLRLHLRSPARARAWLAAHPPQVLVDGRPVPAAGVLEAADRLRVHFRVAAGAHEVVVFSQGPGRPRIVHLSTRVDVAAS